MAAVGPGPATMTGRQNQLEYLLQGSADKTSLPNLLHRLRGLCDNAAPIEFGAKDKSVETFSDHEIIYTLRSGTNSVTLRARRSLDAATAPWQLRYVGQAEMGDKSRASLVRSCIEVATSDNLTSFLEELGFRFECDYVLKGYYFYKGPIRVVVSQVYKHFSHGSTTAVGDANLEAISDSYLVEISLMTAVQQDSVAEELKTFAEHLKPLVHLEKVDHRKVQMS